MTKSALRVGVHEAKTRLSELLRLVEGGQEVEVLRGGTPVARLVAVQPERKPRVFGTERGKWEVADDFDDDLPEEILAEFYRPEL